MMIIRWICPSMSEIQKSIKKDGRYYMIQGGRDAEILWLCTFVFVPTIWNTGNGTIQCGQQSHLVYVGMPGSVRDWRPADYDMLSTGSRSEGIWLPECVPVWIFSGRVWPEEQIIQLLENFRNLTKDLTSSDTDIADEAGRRILIGWMGIPGCRLW